MHSFLINLMHAYYYYCYACLLNKSINFPTDLNVLNNSVYKQRFWHELNVQR